MAEVENKTWRIPVQWQMAGFVRVTAPTLESAMKRAYATQLPGDSGAFVDGSLRVDEPLVRSTPSAEEVFLCATMICVNDAFLDGLLTRGKAYDLVEFDDDGERVVVIGDDGRPLHVDATRFVLAELAQQS